MSITWCIHLFNKWLQILIHARYCCCCFCLTEHTKKMTNACDLIFFILFQVKTKPMDLLLIKNVYNFGWKWIEWEICRDSLVSRAFRQDWTTHTHTLKYKNRTKLIYGQRFVDVIIKLFTSKDSMIFMMFCLFVW